MESQNLQEKFTSKYSPWVIPKGSMAATVFGSSIFAETCGVVEIIWGYLRDLWQTDMNIFIWEVFEERNYERSERNCKKKWMYKIQNKKEQPPNEFIAMHSLGDTNFPPPRNIQINMLPFIYGKKDSLPQAYHGY